MKSDLDGTKNNLFIMAFTAQQKWKWPLDYIYFASRALW